MFKVTELWILLPVFVYEDWMAVEWLNVIMWRGVHEHLPSSVQAGHADKCVYTLKKYIKKDIALIQFCRHFYSHSLSPWIIIKQELISFDRDQSFLPFYPNYFPLAKKEKTKQFLTGASLFMGITHAGAMTTSIWSGGCECRCWGRRLHGWACFAITGLLQQRMIINILMLSESRELPRSRKWHTLTVHGQSCSFRKVRHLVWFEPKQVSVSWHNKIDSALLRARCIVQCCRVSDEVACLAVQNECRWILCDF